MTTSTERTAAMERVVECAKAWHRTYHDAISSGDPGEPSYALGRALDALAPSPGAPVEAEKDGFPCPIEMAMLTPTGRAVLAQVVQDNFKEYEKRVRWIAEDVLAKAKLMKADATEAGWQQLSKRIYALDDKIDTKNAGLHNALDRVEAEAMTEELEGSSCPFCASMYAPNTEHVCRQIERVREIAREEVDRDDFHSFADQINKGMIVWRARVAALESAKPPPMTQRLCSGCDKPLGNPSEHVCVTGVSTTPFYVPQPIERDTYDPPTMYRATATTARAHAGDGYSSEAGTAATANPAASQAGQSGSSPTSCTGCEDRIADSDYHSCVPSEPGSETNAPQKMGRGAPPLSRGTGETTPDARAERLWAMWDRNDCIGQEITTKVNIAAEIRAAEVVARADERRKTLEEIESKLARLQFPRHGVARNIVNGALASGSRTEPS